MKYSFIHNGIKIELPSYNFDTDDKISSLTDEISKGGSLRKISKKIFDFCEELIGNEKIIEVIGEFDSCDPNELQILYKEILTTYAEPLVSYEQEKLSDMYDFDAIEKVMDVAERAQNFKVI